MSANVAPPPRHRTKEEHDEMRRKREAKKVARAEKRASNPSKSWWGFGSSKQVPPSPAKASSSKTPGASTSPASGGSERGSGKLSKAPSASGSKHPSMKSPSVKHSGNQTPRIVVLQESKDASMKNQSAKGSGSQTPDSKTAKDSTTPGGSKRSDQKLDADKNRELATAPNDAEPDVGGELYEVSRPLSPNKTKDPIDQPMFAASDHMVPTSNHSSLAQAIDIDTGKLNDQPANGSGVLTPVNDQPTFTGAPLAVKTNLLKQSEEAPASDSPVTVSATNLDPGHEDTNLVPNKAGKKVRYKRRVRKVRTKLLTPKVLNALLGRDLAMKVKSSLDAKSKD
ncbi:MAG: hypothetical protein M1814_000272 [Vezdaea aestivalis]|nr:MAG: hypothetical protein M1814_000272 [Vezdaea aestivalis]